MTSSQPSPQGQASCAYTHSGRPGEAKLPGGSPGDRGTGGGAIELTEGLGEAWTFLLARYHWDCFATLTFRHPRHDPFEIVNAFNLWLFKWHCIEAMAVGKLTEMRIPRKDAYGRPLSDRVRRRGPFINAWKRDKLKPVYCLGIEPHKSGSLHMHAVIRFDVPWTMHRTVGWRVWSARDYDPGMDMGRSQIEPPRSQGDVLDYCSKYVTKGADLVLSPSFNARCVHADYTRDLRLSD